MDDRDRKNREGETYDEEAARFGERTPEDEGIPDLDPVLPQKRATGDAQEGLPLPGDKPEGADEHGTTATEHREGESLDDRLAEEESDRAERGGREQAGRLAEEGMGLRDQEKDEVADEAEPDRRGLSAEEAAMRVEEDAPGGVPDADQRDRYVEEP